MSYLATRFRARRGLFAILISLLLTFSFSLPVYGASYYVSKAGKDSNPGTEKAPYKSIKKACEKASAGDTVYIKGGTYRERVLPRNSGTQGNYITYKVYPGDTVTIDGKGISLPSDWGGLFDISGKSYIKVSGLQVINAGPYNNNAGILVDRSNHIVIEKNYTYNTVSSGIAVWNSSDIVIDSNEVELACNDGEQECITVARTDRFEVMNNHVHHGGPGTIGGEGIDIKDGSSNGKVYKNYVHHVGRLGIYVDAWDKHTYNIEVFQNMVHDCADDGFTLASEAGGLLENISIYNNIAYNSRYCGITISPQGEDVSKHPMKNIKVINNTFYKNGSKEWGGGISIENPDTEDVLIRNNIVSQNLIFQIQVEVSVKGLTIDHNLIDSYRGYDDEIYGKNYVKGDPLFVNPSIGDFHLKKGSPAIGSGSSLSAPGFNFDGDKSPHGTGYNIGAF